MREGSGERSRYKAINLKRGGGEKGGGIDQELHRSEKEKIFCTSSSGLSVSIWRGKQSLDANG